MYISTRVQVLVLIKSYDLKPCFDNQNDFAWSVYNTFYLLCKPKRTPFLQPGDFISSSNIPPVKNLKVSLRCKMFVSNNFISIGYMHLIYIRNSFYGFIVLQSTTLRQLLKCILLDGPIIPRAGQLCFNLIVP